ncbi:MULTISPECIES: hypothetical protein [Acidianus]|jgi:hypothetical protein|uniref:Uncharacterized protein n=2 Tax=Acidianus TaxID=12914 RepID=A0A650CY09_ACIAM|nr:MULTISPECIES: hypothetical protein [Acidianus]AEE93833.1 hypothetical protein Ahos_0947 [Acidianus hospitalis W1]MDT7901582.1 hypothetical protein [Acidianus sp.]MQL54946.1 hypothetical protein [Acidianus ambivalens]QGR22730.1 hypothetical protein D1866_12645 [Acidianus ambivalens]
MTEEKQEQERRQTKRWDRFTWTVVVGPLAFFFVLSIGLALYLNNFGPWRAVVPVVIGFAIFFFIMGVFLRSKFGRLAF